MKIERKILKEALEIVKAGLSKNDIIEQSDSFAFLDNRVVTYNDELSISHPVPDLNLTGAIKADEFLSLLSKMKVQDIEMEIDGSEILISSGKVKAGLTLHEEVKLPLSEIGKIEKWKKLPANFGEALNMTHTVVSNSSDKPVLTCVHINGEGRAEASDGFSIMRFMLESFPFDKLLLPGHLVPNIIKITPTHISLSDGWAHFKNKAGTVLSCRVFEDDYVNTDKFFGQSGETVPFPKNLADMVEKASIFSKVESGNYLLEQIKVSVSKNRFKVRAMSDTGWFEEMAAIKYSGDALSFSISPFLMKRILYHGVTTFELTKSMIFISQDNWEYAAGLRAAEK